MMLVKILFMALMMSVVLSNPEDDRMTQIPGYPDDFNTSIYAGYLELNENRSNYYVFVENIKGASNTAPLTLWLNGGPLCSSLLGFIQEIGPYYLEDGKQYKEGDNLTHNPSSWHIASNLLFLESPAGVGFSYNLEEKFKYTDGITAQDNLKALKMFYQKFPGYEQRGLWIAGESYAGKYIPDLAQQIFENNKGNGTKINLKGILVGNGIMSFKHLTRSEIEFFINRQFVDPQIISYWKTSCQIDELSAGCRYFNIQFQKDIDEINNYNVYGYCYYNGTVNGTSTPLRFESQASILTKLKREYSEKVYQAGSAENIKNLTYRAESVQEEIENGDETQKSKYNGAPCAYFDGMYNYFNINKKAYHAKFPEMKWNGPCASNISYTIDTRGSIDAYKYLLIKGDNNFQIVQYNGNWDAVVPYIDTLKNMQNELNLTPSNPYHPWFHGDQHAGFSQIYNGMIFTTLKGASHQAPQSKRQVAFQMYTDILAGHPEFKHPPRNAKLEQE